MKLIISILFTLATINASAVRNWYFSNSGNDNTGNGTIGSPYATPAKANSLTASLVAGDSLLFKRGDVFYGKLVIAKSGTASLPIVYSAYGTGSKPIIRATKVLTFATTGTPNVYVSNETIGAEQDPQGFIINDVSQEVGRYPDPDATGTIYAGGGGGYLNVEASSSTSVTDNNWGSLPTAIKNATWVGAEIFIRSDAYRVTKTTITSESGTTTKVLGFASGLTTKIGNGFVLQRALATLSRKGEWYYNSSDKMNVWLDNPPTSEVFEVPVYENSVTIQGTPSVDMKYIKIVNIDFTGANDVGIYGEYVQNVIIDGCDITNNGSKGIYLRFPNDCKAIDVNTYNNPTMGIQFVSGNRDTVYNPTVRNTMNIMNHCKSGQNGYGINMDRITGARVLYPKVYNSGYDGIATTDRSDMTVQYFIIDSACTKMDDGGGIYTFNSVKGTRFSPTMKWKDGIVMNVFGGSIGKASTSVSSPAVYFDRESADVECTNVSVYNCKLAMQWNTPNHLNVTGNMLAKFDRGLFINDAQAAIFTTNNIFSNNVLFSEKLVAPGGVYSPAGLESVHEIHGADTARRFGTMDNNRYGYVFAPTGTAIFYTDDPDPLVTQNSMNLAKWQSTYSGYDQNSVMIQKGALTVNPATDVFYAINTTNATQAIAIPWAGVDVYGNKKIGTISVAPYSIAPVMKDANSSTVPPVVSITSPVNGSVFSPSPASVTINATATDADGTVANVKFYINGTLVNTDNTAPYSYTPSLTAGTYTLLATATDNSGAVGTSTSKSIRVNASPTVSLTAPTNGQTYTAIASVTMNATAADADGTVTKVDFYNGATLVGTDNTSPYTFTQTIATPGTYSLTAKATDNDGAQTTSSAISITVNNATPTVSITSPLTGSTFTAPANITLNASASDVDGTITSVSFYNGVTLLGTDNTSPYTYNWTGVNTGTYSITAKATDNLGAVGTSSSITVTVNNVLPTVALTSPTNGATATALASFTVSANANDANGTIASVAFYANGSLLNTDGTAPYTYNWTNVNTGSYNLTAVATDNEGGTTTSSTVTVTVNNAAPTVSITTPANGATYTAPASIGIAATAADANGTVTSVSFYAGATFLNTDLTAPYSYTWTGVPAGTYSLTAVATDNNSLTTTSTPVSVTVSNPANIPPTTAMTSPANNATFTSPSDVVLTATASDVDGTIANVKFYSEGTTLLATITTPPYTYTWTGKTTGVYNVNSVATDNLGATGTSTPIAFSVTAAPNTPPTVSITSPATGTVFNEPATINLAATAADADGTVSSVAFYNGTTLLGVDMSSPYTYSWTPVTAGTYSVTAIATDNAGSSTTSTAISVTVNSLPVINITAPANNTTYQSPATINITASAFDADGTITSVKFYNGATLLNTDNTAPYAYSWTPVSSGTYTITAKATDNNSAEVTSSAITVIVNDAPTISITAPTNGQTYTSPASVTITATATDGDGSISKVEFYNGATLLSTDLSAPYTYIWNGVTVGSYSITAKAYDNLGLVTTSSPIGIVVGAPANIPPTVSIISPSNGSSYLPNTPILISAIAADVDGTVANVKFYDGTVLLATTTGTFNYTFGSAAMGTHIITAVATDNSGASTTSTAINILITDQIKIRLYNGKKLKVQ